MCLVLLIAMSAAVVGAVYPGESIWMNHRSGDVLNHSAQFVGRRIWGAVHGIDGAARTYAFCSAAYLACLDKGLNPLQDLSMSLFAKIIYTLVEKYAKVGALFQCRDHGKPWLR